MARRRTEEEKRAVVRELMSKPAPDGTLNLRLTNGVHDTGWLVVPGWMAHEIDNMLNEGRP